MFAVDTTKGESEGVRVGDQVEGDKTGGEGGGGKVRMISRTKECSGAKEGGNRQRDDGNVHDSQTYLFRSSRQLWRGIQG